MAKSKNHTNHNQNRKAHRNPTRKPKNPKHPSLQGGTSELAHLNILTDSNQRNVTDSTQTR